MPETEPHTRLTLRGLTTLGSRDTSHTRSVVVLEPIVQELLIALSPPLSDGKICSQCHLPLDDAKPLEKREHASVMSSDVGPFDAEITYQAATCQYCGAVQIGVASAAAIAEALAHALTQVGVRVVSEHTALRTEGGDSGGRLLSCRICNARIGVFTAQCTTCRTSFTWRERLYRVGAFIVLWFIAWTGWSTIGLLVALPLAGQPSSLEAQLLVFIGAIVLGFLTAVVLVRWLWRVTAERRVDDVWGL
jgi:hypothetical protein